MVVLEGKSSWFFWENLRDRVFFFDEFEDLTPGANIRWTLFLKFKNKMLLLRKVIIKKISKNVKKDLFSFSLEIILEKFKLKIFPNCLNERNWSFRFDVALFKKK